jgi:hypothetical protein
MSTEHGPHDPTVFHLHGEPVPDPRLADLFDALRSPATPAELASEPSVLDQMVTALTTPAAATASTPAKKERRPMKSHLLRTIAFATAGTLSVGGVAAAATGTNPLAPILSESDSGSSLSEPVSTTSPSTTSSTVVSTTSAAPTTTAAAAVPVVSAPTDCPKNHGERVSAVAKDHSLDDGRPHGERVSAVARDKDGTARTAPTTTVATLTPATSTTLAALRAAATGCGEPQADDDDDEVRATTASTTTEDDDARDTDEDSDTDDDSDDDDADEDEDEDDDDDADDEVRTSTTMKAGRSGASESSGKSGRGR